MAELPGGKRRQPSSRPEGCLPTAIVVQLELTCRAVMLRPPLCGYRPLRLQPHVANDQASLDAGLWLSPHELEKDFKVAKRVNPRGGPTRC